jgi:hypothetical protein
MNLSISTIHVIWPPFGAGKKGQIKRSGAKA